jgi:protein gp37
LRNNANSGCTTETWNPITGCTKVSPGCKHCYAERIALRLQAIGQPKYANGFRVTLHQDALQRPHKWKRPRRVFVNSMSDLFHDDVPDEFILRVFNVMHAARQHAYMALTKRAERLSRIDAILPWASHISMGVTVENAEYAWRIGHLRQTGARVKFLSLEPLLGPLPDLDLAGIDRVFVGPESGPNARPMDPRWVTDIRDQCDEQGVSFTHKQRRGRRRKRAGRALEGIRHRDLPPVPPRPAGSLPEQLLIRM